MSDVNLRWGVIDEVSIAEARKLVGVQLRRDRMRWNDVATQDAVRQFADGIGDDNPLWLDKKYAERTRWGRQLAPPSFLYAIDATIVAPKLPGVQWIYAGTRWRWYDVISIDDAIDVDAKLKEVEEKEGRRFGLWVLQKGEIVFRHTDKRLICVAEGRVARTPRRQRSKTKIMSSAARESAAPNVKMNTPDPADQASYSPMIAPEGRRGEKQRLWEHVQLGDVLGPVAVQLTLEKIYAWYVGAQGALHYGGAHGDGVRYRRRHDDYEINHKTGAKDSAARGHFSSKEGKDVGMGGAYDVGLQRIAWVVSALTDWMGDDAHLAEVDVDVLAPNLVGDTTYISGRVTHSWIDHNAFVAFEIEGRNQSGNLTTRGYALIALPSESCGPVVLPLFGGDRDRWTCPPSEE